MNADRRSFLAAIAAGVSSLLGFIPAAAEPCPCCTITEHDFGGADNVVMAPDWQIGQAPCCDGSAKITITPLD